MKPVTPRAQRRITSRLQARQVVRDAIDECVLSSELPVNTATEADEAEQGGIELPVLGGRRGLNGLLRDGKRGLLMHESLHRSQ